MTTRGDSKQPSSVSRALALAPLVVLAASALFALGCDCAGPTRPSDGGPVMDTSVGDAGRDGGARDTGADTSPDGGPAHCRSDLDCPAGLLCFGGLCQPDPCATNNPCGDTERCRAVCVALVDPCAGVTCGADETCIDGSCFPGCLPVACEGVSCPTGQYCNPATGSCADLTPCDAACGTGHACNLTCTPRSACEGVTCPEGQFCREIGRAHV